MAQTEQSESAPAVLAKFQDIFGFTVAELSKKRTYYMLKHRQTDLSIPGVMWSLIKKKGTRNNVTRSMCLF